MRTASFAWAILLILGTGCSVDHIGLTGELAPDFLLPTPAGGTILLSSMKGKVVVLDFWATWCVPCVEALPHLQKVGGDEVVAVAVNEQDKAESIRQFLAGKGFTFRVADDTDGAVARMYGVSTLPTTVIIGADGMVQAQIVGWTTDTARQIDGAVARAVSQNR
jgi:cytochrome c biogenesis protein CcmG/thiol:disulfide interchange protein DsbE